VTAAALLLVRAYQRGVSPLLGARCKYHPSCSQYALEALRELGFVRGTLVASWRLLRCNPWSDGGVDHVRDRSFFRP
jgi:putative membrane protein insertion efficiency factor